jgi:NADH-quinone oxidoreductase subunit G
MAVATEVQTVTITVNDVEIQVPKGEMIVESVKRLGIDIPIFCYHPRLKPVGMCRMCLVEVATKGPDGTVRRMPKPQTACSLPASDGLIIWTESEAIHRDRKGVLEFLLINHPLDCPICDRGGECPLQNNTLFYGPSTSRYVEMKRHAPKAFPLSKYVTLDLERCIQCGRCVRFTEEISGDGQLAFRFRGANMQPSTFKLTDFDSKFSGNVIEICPVGALTSSKYRFRARPWDLQTRPGVCTLCSNGCNIHVDYRKNEIARINGRTNELVNEEWTCDKGKFGHYDFNSTDRLTSAMVRVDGGFAKAEHADAYGQIIEAFTGGKSVAAITGGDISVEDMFSLKRLFTEAFGSSEIDGRFEKFLPATDGVSAQSPMAIADYEAAASILVFGTSLSDEEPILFLRVRKAWFQRGTKVIVAHHAATDVDSFAHLILRYAPGTEAILARGLAGSESLESVAVATGVSIEKLTEARELVKESAVITTRGIYERESGADAVAALSSVGTHFSNYSRTASGEGAALLGLSDGATARQILAKAAAGEIKALWLAGVDPFEQIDDQELVTAALENVEFLVFQHWKLTEAGQFASVVLPMAAPAERDGSYVNIERRLQTMAQVLPTQGDAKPAWKAFSDISLRVKPSRPYFSAEEVLADAKASFAAPVLAG